MAEDDAPSDKPYDPTPHRLEEARKRGEIVRSADLNTAVTYLGFLIAGAMVAPWATDGLGRLTQVLLGQAHEIAPLVLAPGGIALAAGLIGRPVLITGAAVAVPAALLLVVLVAQRGLLFSPTKLAPKISRISPLDNAKQKFGAQAGAGVDLAGALSDRAGRTHLGLTLCRAGADLVGARPVDL